jgi:hypothetical protein
MSGEAKTALLRALNQQKTSGQPDIGSFDEAILRKLQDRGIADVSALLPDLEDAEQAHLRRVIEFLRAEEQDRIAAEERREAKENPPPQTAADKLRCALAGTTSPAHIPLNGAGVLRAALGGQPGTINGA